jgi:hypothetical protein
MDAERSETLRKLIQPGVYSMSRREDEIKKFGELGDQRAVEPLCSILKDNSECIGIKIVAAQALGKIGSPNALKQLLVILFDPPNPNDSSRETETLKEMTIDSIAKICNEKKYSSDIHELPYLRGERQSSVLAFRKLSKSTNPIIQNIISLLSEMGFAEYLEEPQPKPKPQATIMSLERAIDLYQKKNGKLDDASQSVRLESSDNESATIIITSMTDDLNFIQSTQTVKVSKSGNVEKLDHWVNPDNENPYW